MRFFHGKNIRTTCLLGISLTAVSIATPVAAQEVEAESTADSSDVIVVSASRRDTDLQDTPLSVSVTSGEALERNSIQSLQDLTKIEPSLVVNNQGVASNQFVIRGILSDIGSTTGLYLDEIPLTGSSAYEGAGDGRPGVRLHDINRIEVLKGPQGTLFGSGSMAGTLRIITNKPDLDLVEGGGSASVGFIDEGDEILEGDVYFNLPLGEQFAIRTVAWGETGGAFIDHAITTLDGLTTTVNEDVNERDVWGVRVSALFEPVPEFSILLSATHQEVDVAGSESWSQGAGPYISTSPTVESYGDNFDLVSATVEYDTNVGTITAIGSYANHKLVDGEDSTPTGLGLSAAFNLMPFKTLLQSSQDYEAYTAELRFTSTLEGPVQFVVGGYYQADDTDFTLIAVRANDVTGTIDCNSVADCEAKGLRPSGFSAPGVPAADLIYAVNTLRDIEQWALYGQVDVELTERLTATAGIRYFDATVSDLQTTIQDIAGPPDFAVPVPVPSWAANGLITTPYVTMDETASESSPSYNFSLLYEATPDLSFFARAASGFRVGGVNNAAAFANQTNITIPDAYDSDKIWSYELGMKAYLADRRIYIDTSIYQMDWSNQPLAATDPSGAFEYIINAGDTRIQGAELQITYNTGMGLSFGGGLTYTDAKLTEDLDQQIIDAGTIGFDGDRIPRVPRWTAAAQVRYDTPVSNSVDMYVQGDISHRSSSTYSFNDQNAFNQTLDASTLLGAQLGFIIDNIDVSLFVRNLTNEVAVYGFDASPDGIRVYSANPRTIGAKVSAHF